MYNIKKIDFLFITTKRSYEIEVEFKNKKVSSQKETKLIIEPAMFFKSIAYFNFKKTQVIFENNDTVSLKLEITTTIFNFLNNITKFFLKICPTFLSVYTNNLNDLDYLNNFIKFSNHKKIYYINTANQTKFTYEKVMCIFCKPGSNNLYDSICYLDKNTKLNKLEINNNIASKLNQNLLKKIKKKGE